MSEDTGKFLIVGIPDTELDGDTLERLRRLGPGGIILFSRNVEDVEQLQELTATLRREMPETLLTVDSEGGSVDRLAPVVGPAPPGAALAGHAKTLAFEAGTWVGRSLALFDFDFDLAPVVDLDRGEADNALGGRYLGASPEQVISRAGAFLRGLQEAGVGGCLKHFPGLGGATRDTHHHSSTVFLPREELARDLQPFTTLAAEAGAIMVGHAIYPAYDSEHRPAPLSPPVVHGLLREKLGFDRLVVSDDLEMKALSEWGDVPERAEVAFAVGCDMLLICHELELAEAAAERLAVPELEPRRRESSRRLERFRQRLETFRIRGQQALGQQWRRTFDLDEVRERLAAVHQAAAKPPGETAAQRA